MLFFTLTLLPLLIMTLVAALNPGRRPGKVPLLSEGAALAAFAFATLGAFVFMVSGGASVSVGTGIMEIAFRVDVVSTVMAVLVTFIGWIVMRYSRSYLDGEAREGAFHSMMLATIAVVFILIHAGSLFILIASLVGIGLGLRQLLLFYADRMAARRAAMKFSIVWFSTDAVLLLAALFLFMGFGSANLATMASASEAGLTTPAHIGVILVVIAALMKTAAFPLQGWLTEVMEAPTPVSALLHAGIINAGGLILLRFADPVQASTGAMTLLVVVGGFTALLGGLVMLTQSAVKTSLAWSTVGQMGFMLLQCGLGLWALALLHIVAHALYKAHAFLSSGGAVRAVNAARKPGPIAVPGFSAVALAFALGLAVYGTIALLFGVLIEPKSAQALALGTILVFGVAYLIAQGLADTAPLALAKRTTLFALATTIGYFSFHSIARFLVGDSLPAAPALGPLEVALLTLTVASFGAVAFAQALFPHWAHHPASAGLRIHLSNGLYTNALFNRLILVLSPRKTAS